jgi:hypothetical protein
LEFSTVIAAERFMDVSELLVQKESETLDFKQKFHARNIDLLHDILCLANAYSEGDRYLVFGVTDKKQLVGIEDDANMKSNAMIQDLLRASKFNRIPSVKLDSQSFDGHTVAVLVIKNRPDKPFFLVADKIEGNDRIRAGIIYTRIGDTNIPLQESAPEDHIELMWRERFGLGLDPLSRLERLVEEKEKWIKVGDESYLYHQSFPEFTIRNGEDLNDHFVMDWTKTFPDPTAWSYYVEARYHTTTLRKMAFVACDGGRYRVPLPKPPETGSKWVINLGSLEYKIAMLYQQYFPLPSTLSGKGLEVISDSTSDVD